MSSRFLLALCCILFVGFALRFWQLGSIPAGPNWDEAAIGYNGWSIWHTRRDEWLERLPISFRSFGDYKAPLAIYLNGVFTTTFGLELWVIRVPFALSGILAVLGFAVLISLLTQHLPKKTFNLHPTALVLVGTVLLAISPWHILFSRVGFESGLALSEVLWATNLLLLSTQRHVSSRRQWIIQFGSILLFSSTFYTYHSAKLMVPLFLLVLFVFLRSHKLIAIKNTVVLLAGMLIVLIPFFLDSLLGNGLARASVTIFAQFNTIQDDIAVLLKNTIAHFSPAFLIFGKADSIRHSIGNMGVLYPTTLLFVLIGFSRGVLQLIFKLKQNRTSVILPIWIFSVGWILSGLAPAIIGIEVPHPNRALLALPGFLLLAVLGIDYVSIQYQQLKHAHKMGGIVVLLLFISIEILQPFVFLFQYFGSYAQKVSPNFQDGYTQMYDEVWAYYDGKDNRSKIDQFVITSEYGQPYIYALLSRKISTYQYHNGALINFLFPDIVQLSDLDRPNALVVAGEKSDLIDRTKASKIIYSSDGKPRFWIFDTNTL